MMNNCMLCGTHLTSENHSKEHIIPRAIGGRIKRGGLICNACNNKKGQEWDQTLFDQLHFLCLHFKITRQGNALPSRIVTDFEGNEYTRLPDGRLAVPDSKLDINVVEGVPRISGYAPDEHSMRRELERLKRQHPDLNINIEKCMAQVSYTSEQPPQPLLMQESLPFGGVSSGRSVVASCLILAGYNGISRETCPLGVDYLFHDGEPCFGYYYSNDLVTGRQEDAVFHCVSIIADPKTSMIYGYVEYFSSFRMVICLSNNYSGDYIKDIYAVNPATGREVKIDVHLNFTWEEIQMLYNYDYCDINKMRTAVDKAIGIGFSQNR